MPRIVVVGAGISGLTVAYRLQSLLPTSEIDVLEEAGRVGGLIRTESRAGYVVEAGPNGFLDTNPATIELAGQLGLEGQLTPASDSASKNRFLLLEGRLRRLPTGLLSFLSSDVLSWVAKLRLLTERFRPPRRQQVEESVHEFARRRVGDEVARTLVDAFVTGIFAGDPKLLSARAAFPRLAGWERDHGSVMRGMAAARKLRRQQPGGARKTGKMWSLQAGLGTLVETLASRLRRAPQLGVRARTVRQSPGGWRVEAEGEDHWVADAVVLTCPASRQAALLAEVDPPMAEAVAAIRSNRVAVVALGYRREDVPHPLDGFGYLSRQRDRSDVLGVQWCSSIFPGRAPPGAVLMRALCGGWHRGEMVDWPDDRLIAAVRGELARAVDVRVAPAFVQIIRWPRAIPQYHVGHLDRVAWVEERLARHPGLFVGGNAYHGVSINDCVEQSSALAERVAGFIAASPSRAAPSHRGA